MGRRVSTGRGGSFTFGAGAAGHSRPHRMTIRRIVRAAWSGTVSVAGARVGDHPVAGLPSTAASAGAPGAEPLAPAARHRTRSGVGMLCGWAEGIVTGRPGRTVRGPVGVVSDSGAPEMSRTVRARPTGEREQRDEH